MHVHCTSTVPKVRPECWTFHEALCKSCGLEAHFMRLFKCHQEITPCLTTILTVLPSLTPRTLQLSVQLVTIAQRVVMKQFHAQLDFSVQTFLVRIRIAAVRAPLVPIVTLLVHQFPQFVRPATSAQKVPTRHRPVPEAPTMAERDCMTREVAQLAHLDITVHSWVRSPTTR